MLSLLAIAQHSLILKKETMQLSTDQQTLKAAWSIQDGRLEYCCHSVQADVAATSNLIPLRNRSLEVA